MSSYQGHLSKMRVTLNEAQQAQYQLLLDANTNNEQVIELNQYLNQEFEFIYQGQIHCQACGKQTKKSYSQGYCYPCMQKLASCDLCIMKPETCHYHQGTCRQPDWGLSHCFQPHYVYLANTSGLKVGISRSLPSRWLDQGATQGLPILKVKHRLLSGKIEVLLAQHVKDKTHWQAMLKGNAADEDLVVIAQQLLTQIRPQLMSLQEEFGQDSIEWLTEPTQTIHYPVQQFPTKVKALNLDKAPMFTGQLQGIKGQYLLFDTGVINIRKYSRYLVQININSMPTQQQASLF